MILSVVVTYYPDEILLRNNISSFIDHVDKVLIWENTPEQEKEKYRYIHHDKVEYCGDGMNSISHGLNFAWQYAEEKGYDFLLTMDQDSFFENFVSMKEYVAAHRKIRCIWCPSLKSIQHDETPCINDLFEIHDVGTVITSGTLVRLEILNDLQGYDEKLPVDGIDTDFSLKAKSKNIRLVCVGGCVLRQRFGNPNVGKLFGMKFYYSSYSAQRLTSILEAHIYLMRKHPAMPSGLKWYIIKKYVFCKFFEILFLENDTFAKISALAKGIINGMRVKL